MLKTERASAGLQLQKLQTRARPPMPTAGIARIAVVGEVGAQTALITFGPLHMHDNLSVENVASSACTW